jgi:AcrR family transcriptional regulator
MPTITQVEVEDSARARREQIARATWKVIARQGLDRTSMREIAQELGMTTGLLTHRFRNRDDLLDFVFDSVVELLEEMGCFRTWTSLDDFKFSLLSMLPAAEETAEWWRVWVSFIAAAYSRPDQHLRHAAVYARTATAWTKTFATLRDKGILRAGIDAELEAESLGFLVEGMGVNAIFATKLDATRQAAILDNHFAKLLA